jgi:hypothetical protein
VPVVLSRAMTGADTPAVEPPVGSVPHVVARSTAVIVPTTPFARRHDAAVTMGAADALVPVRDDVAVASPDAAAVEGPVPQSVESDACATGSVETVDGAGLVTSPRRQRAATAAPPEVTVVPVIPFEASTCPPLPALDAPPLHSELSTACDGWTLHWARRQITTWACAPPFTLDRVVGSLALTAGSVPSAAPAPADPAVSEDPPFDSVAVLCVTPGPLMGAEPVTLAGPLPVERPLVSGDVTVVPPEVTVVLGTVTPAVVPVVVAPADPPVVTTAVGIGDGTEMTAVGMGPAEMVVLIGPGSAKARAGIIAESAATTRTLIAALIFASIYLSLQVHSRE